jgi:predicted Zn finger-like uncharacterized protein
VLTECPNCQTVFRVTSTILRAAHGQVRCGKCATQFDAIEHLLEGEDAVVAENTGIDATEQPQASYEGEAISHEDIVLEGNRIEISGVYRRPAVHLDDDEEGDEANTRTIIEEFNISGDEWPAPIDDGNDLDDIDAESDAMNVADENTETELDDIEQEISAAEIADAMASLEAVTVAMPVNTSDSAADSSALIAPKQVLFTANSDTPPKASLDDELFGRTRTTRRWPWLAASIALTVLLLAQTVHHARAALARHPSIGPQVTKLYAAIGQPLAPQWQLQAYSIKQWGIVSDPQTPGTLRVRASVTNGASFAQPYPLLQLTLEDRFGGNVGKRSFKPEEYLGNQTLATRLLGAGEAANIDLAIVDPGAEAVGFQFDTCLQLANELLQCTHDLPAAQP